MILISRNFGEQILGEISIFIALGTILGIPVQNGISTWLVRDLTENGIDKFRILITRYKMLVAGVIGYILFLISIQCMDYYKAFNVNEGFLLVLYVSSVGLLIILSAVLRAASSAVVGVVIEGSLRPFIFFSIIASFALSNSHNRISADFIIISLILSYIVAIIVAIIYIVKEVEPQPRQKQDSNYQGISKLIISSGIMVLFTNLDVLLIGSMIDEVAAGKYRLIAQISGLGSIVLMVLNQIHQKEIKLSCINDDYVLLQKSVSKIIKYSSISTILFAVAVLAVAENIFLLSFREIPEQAWSVLLILLSSQLLNSFFGPVGTILNMYGLEDKFLKAVTEGIAINIILSLWLISIAGIRGAAIASFFATFHWNFRMYREVERKLKIKIFLFPLNK